MIAAGAFVVAAVFYSAWVPGQFVTPKVDRTHGYVSELAARDQPWSMMFRLSDCVAGLACLLGVALVPRVAREWLGWLGLAAFGLFTIGDTVFPLDCAALSDPTCAGGPLAHTVTSALATAGVLLSMVVLSRRWHSTAAWVITGAALVATVLTLVTDAVGGPVGVAQRVQLTLIAVWLLYLAVRLLTSEVATAETVAPVIVADGGGPAVLLASGLGGSWRQWDAVAAALAPERRVIRFDRPGHTPPTLYGEAARLAALAPDHPHKVTVVAHSMAAFHAEAFARLHPVRVQALVLVDPSCEGKPKRPTTTLGKAVGRWLPALGGTWLMGRRGPWLATAAGEWLAYRDMAADLRAIRQEHPLTDLPVVLISAGKRDRCQEALAAELNARLVRLPDSGHMVQLDRPDAVADACRFNAE